MASLPIAGSRAEALANFDKMTEASRYSVSLISAALAAPHTHEVVTTYADGTEKRHGARSAAAALTHADCVERPKIGRDLLDRESGTTVRVVSVTVSPIDLAARMKQLAPGFYTERDGGRWYVITPEPNGDRIAEDFADRDDARRLVCFLAGDPLPEGWHTLNRGLSQFVNLFGPKMLTATIWTKPAERHFPGALARLPVGIP